MPLRGCSSGGLWATALVVFLALPVQYYVPDFSRPKDLSADPLVAYSSPPSVDYLHWISLEHLPPVDLFLTISVFLLAIFTYLCDWIQRKIMERRIVNLNRHLSESVQRLRGSDARRERLERTLRMVRAATAEYNVLLLLLLRRRQLGAHRPPPSPCFLDKEMDDLAFLRNAAVDV